MTQALGRIKVKGYQAIAYTDQVVELVQAAWDQEGGKVAVAVSATKALATRSSLNVVNHISEMAGTRSTFRYL